MIHDKHRQFALDLRRVLYLGQIQLVFLQWLRESKVCPSGIKQKCINTEASIKSIINTVLQHTTVENRKDLLNDLSKDQLNDIANLLGLVADVENISDIVEAVTIAKKEGVPCT